MPPALLAPHSSFQVRLTRGVKFTFLWRLKYDLAEFPALPSSAPVRPVSNWGVGPGAAASEVSVAPSAAGVRKIKTNRGDVLLL